MDTKEALKQSIKELQYNRECGYSPDITTIRMIESVLEAMPREASASSGVREALVLARAELRKHNSEYHHVTKPDVFDKIDAALSKPSDAGNASVEMRLREDNMRDGLTDLERTLLTAARAAQNYIANTESELGMTLKSGDFLRTAIAKAEACAISAGDEAKKSEGAKSQREGQAQMGSVKAKTSPSALEAGDRPSSPSAGRREIVAQALRRFHRNSCYPDALDDEVVIGVETILAALDGGRDA